MPSPIESDLFLRRTRTKPVKEVGGPVDQDPHDQPDQYDQYEQLLRMPPETLQQILDEHFADEIRRLDQFEKNIGNLLKNRTLLHPKQRQTQLLQPEPTLVD
jgi:hypothetical protein